MPGVTGTGRGPADSAQRHKSNRVDTRHEALILARENAKPFDADVVEVLTLVELDNGESEVLVDLDSGTAQVRASAGINRVWEVPVKAMNGLMAAERDPEVDAQIRNVLIPLDDLADFQVFPPK